MEKEKTNQTIGIRIPKSVGLRLETLAKRTGRTKAFYIREAILEHLDDLKEAYVAETVLEQVNSGKETISRLEEVEQRLGLGN